MDKEETNMINTIISERAEGEETGPLFQIRFLEGGGRGICGGAVAGGEILCMSLVGELNTASHTRVRRSGEDHPGVKEGAGVVMSLFTPCHPYYTLFQIVLGGSTASNAKFLRVSCCHHTH